MTSTKLGGVVPAPPWLIKRMKLLRKMPRPPLSVVRTQLKASAKFRLRQLEGGK